MSRTGIEPLEARRLFFAVTGTIEVTTTADSGPGSLRQAVLDAQPGNRIVLESLSGTIVLGSTISIDKDILIDGPDAQTLTISGNDAIRPFSIGAATVRLDDLTISNGYSPGQSGAIDVTNGASLMLHRMVLSHNSSGSGGAMFIDSGGNVTMHDSVVTGNVAGTNGAGIFSGVGSTISLTNCTISNNSVTSHGNSHFAGFAEGGGLELLGTSATLVNCTITGNTLTASDFAGDPWNAMGSTDGYARGAGIFMGNGAISITHCTIAGNDSVATSVQGGGVQWLGNGSLVMNNTIIADNTGGDHPDAFIPAGTVSGSGNLLGAFNQPVFSNGLSGNIVGTTGSPIDPGLLTLADNGGSTQTIALAIGSPAIDAASVSFATSRDQRDANRDLMPDIGAYEYANAAPQVVANTHSHAHANAYFSFDIVFEDTDGDDMTIFASAVPSWAQFVDNGDGTASISGTPTILDAGLHVPGFHVNDGRHETTQIVNVQVYVPDHTIDSFGTLIVHGTDEADEVLISRRGDDLIRLSRNGVARNFYASSIESIQILTYEGNDTITVETGGIGVYVLGGAGNDTITGGSQNDTLVGAGSKDLIYGMGGDDWLYGSAGNDVLFGGEGNDRVNGGDANDILDGGSGRDRLDGGEGDDYIHAYDRRPDYIFGGLGTDTAWLDYRRATETTFGDLEVITYLDA